MDKWKRLLKTESAKVDRGMYTVLAVGIVMTLLLPDTGELALWDVLSCCIWMMAAGIVLLRILIRDWGKGGWTTRLLCPILAGLFLFGGLMTAKNLTMDVVEGSQLVHLTSCTVGENHNRKGAVTGYYLTGYDENGVYHRIKISWADYERLDGEYIQLRSGVTVRCYLHSGRAISARL